jgi:hypothetical protein
VRGRVGVSLTKNARVCASERRRAWYDRAGGVDTYVAVAILALALLSQALVLRGLYHSFRSLRYAMAQIAQYRAFR